MLNLNQLRAFYEMARALNFSVAAEKLSVTQPAISKQVKCLEEFCDLRLYRKKREKIFLTDEGKKVFVYATQIFEMERQLEQVIIGFKNLRHGSLRIGTTKTYARWFIPPLLSIFQKQFPNVIIELDEGSSLEMSKSVTEFRNSLAIVAKIENDPDIQFDKLMEEEVVLVAAPDHPLSDRGRIDFFNLKGVPIVMKEVGSGTRKLVEEQFSKQNTKPNIVAQTSNMEFIKQMVKKDKALSFVVKGAVEHELSEGQLVGIPTGKKRLLLEIYFAYHKHYELPYTARSFFEFVMSSTRGKEPPIGMQAVLDRINKSLNG